ncbi:MAG: UDP-2,3-diacylglucosamine diphosphatase [Proteobacteria bacterium]|nr:UDP-2,3-diacylglucosamine diphosphatase [Pseudomonadota bacterium]
MNKQFFIADLHLSQKHTKTTDLFVDFIKNKACGAQTLYILGDLFEYWLGDDAQDQLAILAKSTLQKLSQNNTQIYYMHGNRDFLLGKEYADACGMQIINDPHIIQLSEEPVLLLHGDEQCVDDIEYQQTRKILRSEAWQKEFLSMSISERTIFANNARKQSQEHTKMANDEIMDVNQDSINTLFSQHQTKLMIHGHTHRPAVHSLNNTTRIVLGDWHNQASYLCFDENGYQLISH